jgi:hypothetical protein
MPLCGPKIGAILKAYAYTRSDLQARLNAGRWALTYKHFVF